LTVATLMLWFSDRNARPPTGWRYVFGQVLLPVS